MSAAKPIQIIGGGLAGLTLGIALRKHEIPVSIFEAGNYPRHKVCGEFISGRGLEILDELGLTKNFLAADAVEARTAIFFSGNSQWAALELLVPALCLSRFVMDKLLAEEFQKLGGDLQAGLRWRNDFGEGIVRANGRRLHPAAKSDWHWFGLKVHAKNIFPAADLEMHVLRNGYVGICKLAGGETNICGLFRRKNSETFHQNGFDLLRGNFGTVLSKRLARAEFDESSFCSVAGLSMRPQRASEKTECSIGDALTMIPPVTGNGMSMAFESAKIASEPLAAFSRGEISWMQARRKIARSCDETFSRRLRWAKLLQWLLFSPLLETPFGNFVFRSEIIWKMMFAKTR